MSPVHLRTVSKLGKNISITKERWDYIITVKHLELKGKEAEVAKTLADPDEIRLSKSDQSTYLYYRKFTRLSLVIVAKHLNGSGFIITAYFTDRIKEGKQIWRKP